MNATTETKARKSKKAPLRIRRRDSRGAEIEYTPEGDLTTKGYVALDEAAGRRKLTDTEIEAMCLFEIEAAHDLLNSDGVRSVRTDPAWDNCPTVYRLEDVHSAWRSATEHGLPNVTAIRDAWNDSSDERCCPGCLCERFLEQALDYVSIDHRAGMIVLQGL